MEKLKRKLKILVLIIYLWKNILRVDWCFPRYFANRFRNKSHISDIILQIFLESNYHDLCNLFAKDILQNIVQNELYCTVYNNIPRKENAHHLHSSKMLRSRSNHDLREKIVSSKSLETTARQNRVRPPKTRFLHSLENGTSLWPLTESRIPFYDHRIFLRALDTRYVNPCAMSRPLRNSRSLSAERRSARFVPRRARSFSSQLIFTCEL